MRIGFRGHFDGSAIQFDDPSAPGYTTVKASNGALLEASWEVRRNIRPWNKSLYIRCLGFLREGDQIEIIFGNQHAGSPGWLMQHLSQHLPFKSRLIHSQHKILLPCQTLIILPYQWYQAILLMCCAANIAPTRRGISPVDKGDDLGKSVRSIDGPDQDQGKYASYGTARFS